MTRPRRGYALIEMLLVISALLMVLGLCVGLIQVLLRLDRVARDHMVEATTRDRLARRFRLDVRSCSKAEPGPAGAGPSDRLDLTGPGVRGVTYLVREGQVVRTERQAAQQVRQETFRLPSRAVPRFERREADGAVFVVLELVSEKTPLPRLAPRRAEYLARPGSDARLAGQKSEEAPR